MGDGTISSVTTSELDSSRELVISNKKDPPCGGDGGSLEEKLAELKVTKMVDYMQVPVIT